jgi:hypothetical protein
LTFVREPLLLGHYRSTRLTGTERVMNRLIGLAMEDSLRVGLYPDPPGTFQAFVNSHLNPSNPFQTPRPEAVIVVGLGEEGKLRGPDLVRTVRQAVIGWAQRIAENGKDAPPLFELAATLIGSGGPGITTGQSAQLIAQGVREANERLDDARSESERPADRLWPRVSHLRLIELYLDRATEAWRALQMQAAATPGRYVVSEAVQSGAGALRRPLDSGYRGADYDFISAESQVGPRGDAMIAYTLPKSACCGISSPVRPTIRTSIRRSVARCSSCWCRWRWSLSSAAPRRCNSRSTRAPLPSRGNCSTP